MTPPKTPADEMDDLLPPIEEPDPDAFEDQEIDPEDVSDELDVLDDEADGDLPGEDDDNPMQDSDDALPDDDEESVLHRNPGKEGGRFEDV